MDVKSGQQYVGTLIVKTWMFCQIEISLTKGKILKVEERVNKLELSDNEVDTVVE